MEGEMKHKENAQCKKPFNSYQSFVKRGQRIKMAAELSMARGIDRQWSRALYHRHIGIKAKSQSHCRKEATADPGFDLTSGSNCGDEEVVTERRVKTLQRLVPGGEDMEIEALFEETADYIEALRGQVNVMRALTQVMDGVARERRLMGG